MKLIHCSDLHLDSKMEALPPHKAKRRQDEMRLSFERMVKYAAENGVRAVLIAGDMFDSQRVSAATVSFVLDTVRGVPQVDFLWLRGNHDEGSDVFAGRKLPGNLRLFSEHWQGYDYGDAVIWGAELSDGIYENLPFDRSRRNIVMLHGQVSAEAGEDRVCLPRLRGCGIDYLALGHIHSYEKQRLDAEGVWCYCGCLEGRGFDECGEKGFVIIDTEGGIKSEFVPFAHRKLHNVEVDISTLATVTEIRDAMRAACGEIDRRDLVKFTLTGTYTPDTQKDLSFLRRAFAEEFFFVKIKDESRLELQREEYINDVSLKGAFIRAVMASDMEESRKENVIMLGLRALRGEEAEL